MNAERKAISRPFRLAREVIRRLEDQVSVAFYLWRKPPGNTYITFYPTGALPRLDGLDDDAA